MKRVFSLLLTLAVVMSTVTNIANAQDDSECNPDMDEPFACRSFESDNLFADIIFLQIIVSDHTTNTLAEQYILDMSDSWEDDGLPQLRMRGLPAGTEYLYSSVLIEEDATSMGMAFLFVSFQNYVFTLVTVGTELPEADDLVDVVSEMTERAETAGDDLISIVPSEQDIPYALSMSGENTEGTGQTSASSSSSNGITRTPLNTSSSSSDSSDSSDGTTRSSRSSSSSSSSSSTSGTSRSSTSTGGLQITDITSSDAGIGDGTIYVYIELENNSSRSYDYVQVDIVCRDQNDRVVATGLANELGLPAGGSTVLTGIVLSAPDCVRIQAQINPISN